MGGAISQRRTLSPIELSLREFLRTSKRVGPSVSLTLVRLNKWTMSIQAGREDAGLKSILAKAGRGPASDAVESIAESLIEGAVGSERKLLSKSLQEALYYCVDFDSGIGSAEFKTRFLRYLNRYGAASFIRKFLSFFFFNFVWSEAGESFRALAWTSDAFEKDMESIDEICQRIVAASWKSFQRTQRRLDRSAAGELARSIELQLRGA